MKIKKSEKEKIYSEFKNSGISSVEFIYSNRVKYPFLTRRKLAEYKREVETDRGAFRTINFKKDRQEAIEFYKINGIEKTCKKYKIQKSTFNFWRKEFGLVKERKVVDTKNIISDILKGEDSRVNIAQKHGISLSYLNHIAAKNGIKRQKKRTKKTQSRKRKNTILDSQALIFAVLDCQKYLENKIKRSHILEKYNISDSSLARIIRNIKNYK